MNVLSAFSAVPILSPLQMFFVLLFIVALSIAFAVLEQRRGR